MSHHSRSTDADTVSLTVHVLHGSRPIALRQFALLFSATVRSVKAAGLIAVAAAVGDSEWELIKTSCCFHRTQSSSHAVVQPHEHSDIGECAKNSQW